MQPKIKSEMAHFAEHLLDGYMHHLGIRHIIACICAKPRNSAFLTTHPSWTCFVLPANASLSDSIRICRYSTELCSSLRISSSLPEASNPSMIPKATKAVKPWPFGGHYDA